MENRIEVGIERSWIKYYYVWFVIGKDDGIKKKRFEKIILSLVKKYKIY